MITPLHFNEDPVACGAAVTEEYEIWKECQESLSSKFWSVAEPLCMVWIQAHILWSGNEDNTLLFSAIIVMPSISMSKERFLIF